MVISGNLRYKLFNPCKGTNGGSPRLKVYRDVFRFLDDFLASWVYWWLGFITEDPSYINLMYLGKFLKKVHNLMSNILYFKGKDWYWCVVKSKEKKNRFTKLLKKFFTTKGHQNVFNTRCLLLVFISCFAALPLFDKKQWKILFYFWLFNNNAYQRKELVFKC